MELLSYELRRASIQTWNDPPFGTWWRYRFSRCTFFRTSTVLHSRPEQRTFWDVEIRILAVAITFLFDRLKSCKDGPFRPLTAELLVLGGPQLVRQ